MNSRYTKIYQIPTKKTDNSQIISEIQEILYLGTPDKELYETIDYCISKKLYEHTVSVKSNDLAEVFMVLNSGNHMSMKIITVDNKKYKSASCGDIFMQGNKYYLVVYYGFIDITDRITKISL